METYVVYSYRRYRSRNQYAEHSCTPAARGRSQEKNAGAEKQIRTDRGKPLLHATCKSVQVCGKFLNIRR
nr:MAG TPA: hypothetical protein [Caudoviricetes sp.]